MSIRGFTLIELLVVVAIVAVLSSMVMVTVGMVRGAARNTLCTSNLRNIAVAVNGYATDNSGELPYRNVNAEWFQQATPYLEGQYQGAPQKTRNDVFHCPFAKSEIANPWLFYYRFSSHYGMNTHIRVAWNETTADWLWGQQPIQLASLAPSLVLLTENHPWTYNGMTYFEDMVDHTVSGGPWPVSLGGASGATAPIRFHGRAVNLVCIDGHTERITGTWDQNAMSNRFRTPKSVL